VIQQITIDNNMVPVIEDIAEKEDWTFAATCQHIWDNYATENVRAHEKDLTDKLIRGLSVKEKSDMVKAKGL
jgi:hypothetical protein